jgi:hypothetical protein
MSNYYRRFIMDFGELAEPLTALSKKGATVKIIGKAQESFEGLKKGMSETPVHRF